MALIEPPADAAQCRQQFPFLQTSEEASGKVGVVLAAHNIRRWLKELHPAATFGVRTKKFSMGDSVNVDYMAWPEYGINPGDLMALLEVFEPGSFNGMTDSFDYDRHPGRKAFRELFGTVKYLHVRGETPSPEDIALRDQTLLRAHVPQATASPGRRGPRL